MDSMHEGERTERLARSNDLEVILSIAGALRAEFGAAIDAHPGGVGTEAGTINRAFRAAVDAILGDNSSPGVDPAAVRTLALRRAALGRLDELGVSGPQAEALLGMEPALRDAWLAYLALAPASVIEDLMRGEVGG